MNIQATAKLTTGVFDAHLLDDGAISRLRLGSSEIVAFRRGSAPDQADRLAALLPGVPVTDGGVVDDVRAAMIECGRRGVLVLAVPQPADARRFVARAI